MRLITYKNREDGAMHVGVLINNDFEVVSLSNNGFPRDMNEIVKLGASLGERLQLHNLQSMVCYETWYKHSRGGL